MKLSQYLSQERGRQKALALTIGAHAPDVSRWAKGTRPIPVEHGAALERATSGLVTRQEMFPDDWQRIWPELVDAPPATRRAADPLPPEPPVRPRRQFPDGRSLTSFTDQPATFDKQRP